MLRTVLSRIWSAGYTTVSPTSEDFTWHRICAWCQRVLQQGSDPKPETTTHGICAVCKQRVLDDAERSRGFKVA